MLKTSNPLFPKWEITFQQDGSSNYALALSKDEIVKGKVLRSLSIDNAILLIKGSKVTARTSLPLKEGSVLSLKVKETSPVPSLKPIGIQFRKSNAVNISSIISALKEDLWKSTFENIFHTLPKGESSFFREFITHLTLRSFSKSSPELLKTIIDGSGFVWERKLLGLLLSNAISAENLNKLTNRDLKGLAARLLSLNQRNEGLENPLNKFVSAITNIQLFNGLEIGQEGKIFLPIPVQFPDGHFTVGRLLIHLPEQEKYEGTGRKISKNLFRITFFLELSRLGPIRADLTVNNKEITGSFFLTNDKARLIIEDKLNFLVGSLEGRGFKVQSIECRVKDPEIITQSFFEDIVDIDESNISVVV